MIDGLDKPEVKSQEDGDVTLQNDTSLRVSADHNQTMTEEKSMVFNFAVPNKDRKDFDKKKTVSIEI